LENDIDTINVRLDTNDLKISDLSTFKTAQLIINTNKNSEILTLNNGVDSLDNRTTINENLLSQHSTKILEIDLLNDNVADIQGIITGHTSNISLNQDDITQAKLDIINLQTKNNDVDILITTLQNNIVDINNELENIATQQSINEIRDGITNIESSLTTINNYISTIISNDEATDVQVTNIITRLDEGDILIEQNRSDIVLNSSGISNNNQSITSIQGDITSIQIDVNSINNTIGFINNSISENKILLIII
jgi:chromosome segregation ATPase